MFTGIIECMGTIRNISIRGDDALLVVDAPIDLTNVRIGDSIAVNGACLTVTAKTKTGFSADVSAETLSRTALKTTRIGDKVNLEKALRLTDFLGGHLVLGHVDGTGKILEKKEKSGSLIIGVSIDEDLTRYIVEKGSITIDGISLTVNKCEKNQFSVNVIPHTAQATTIGFKKVNALVNIETDILGKYIEKLLMSGTDKNPQNVRNLDLNFLAEHGYL
ncbi:MAG: riboflavin synthase [Deltaproteobacteria bacterium]|nr:riboflavin synthase [Deltaproteobacteria bacterium]